MATVVVCYIDDLLIIAKTYQEYQMALHELLWLWRKVGFQINYDKLEGTSQKWVFLDFEIDLLNISLSIPDEKMHEVWLILVTTIDSQKVMKRELLSVFGRYHLRRLIDRCNTLRSSWHKRRVSKDMKLD